MRFCLEGDVWPLTPRTSFYDWLYFTALIQSDYDIEKLFLFEGFTDIEFNPSKSINCQARSAAMFVGLNQAGLIQTAMNSKEEFILIGYPSEEQGPLIQESMF